MTSGFMHHDALPHVQSLGMWLSAVDEEWRSHSSSTV